MSSTTQLTTGSIFVLGIFIIDNFLLIESVDSPENMVWIESGSFLMGSDRGMPDEFPSHEVTLDGFFIDKFEVTNADYREFAAATGHLTFSEKVKDSMVFAAPQQSHARRLGPLDWWQLVQHADWQHPQGPDDNIEGRADHPVVQVSYEDALAYCNWLDKDLPTEAQYEYAARGGKQGEIYSWGSEPRHQSEAIINNWQGDFPHQNHQSDGFAGTAPVGSFAANDFGLHDITGNVWEWVSDWYHPAYYAMSPLKNPQGVTETSSIDPAEPGLAKRSIRGGSFLCSDNYCMGFRVSARMPAAPDSSSNHTGFRCVKNRTLLERFSH